ncbi:MAG: hypothetical protein QXX95_05650 [Nitrososphaerales archaeon]
MISKEPYKLSSLYYKLKELNAKFSLDEFNWLKADVISNKDEERENAKKNVGLTDLSNLGKFSLKGKDLFKNLRRVYCKNCEFSIGKIFAPSSKEFKDSICCILTIDEGLILVSPKVFEDIRNKLYNYETECFHITDITSFLNGILLIGPKSPLVLSKLTEFNLDEFEDLSVTFTPLSHVNCILLRKDIGETSSYLILFERAYGEYLWETIIRAGKEFQIKPIGRIALRELGLGWD